MGSRFWLAAGPFEEGGPTINLSRGPSESVNGDSFLCIPVVQIATGSTRTQMYGGVFRQPRIRVYSDQIATPTKASDLRELSFSILMEELSWDQIAANWSQIHSFLDRAEVGASFWPRGSGMLLVEQLEDQSEFTLHDVASGVFTDVDMGVPGFNRIGGVVQLSVVQFGRRMFPTIVPQGSTLTNGPNGKLFVENFPGDAEGPCEVVVRDESDMGHVIRAVTLGRRWFPGMPPDGFTHCYTDTGTITTSGTLQQIVRYLSAGRAHDTGLFHTFAVVNDASPVIGQASCALDTITPGAGSVPSGVYSFAAVPVDSGGKYGPASGVITAAVQNLIQSGAAQEAIVIIDFDDAESQQWLLWKRPPFLVDPGTTGTEVLIDNTSPLEGTYSFHFKTVSSLTSGVVETGSAARVLPAVANFASKSNIKDVGFLFKADSWAASGLRPAPSAPTLNGLDGSSDPIPTLLFPDSTPGNVYTAVMTLRDQYGNETTPSASASVTTPAHAGGSVAGWGADWDAPASFLDGNGIRYDYVLYAAPVNEVTPFTEIATSTLRTPAGQLAPWIRDDTRDPVPATNTLMWDNFARISCGTDLPNPDNLTATQFNGLRIVANVENPTGTFDVIAYTGLGTTPGFAFQRNVLAKFPLSTGKLYWVEFNYDASREEPQMRLYVTDVTDGPSPNVILVAGFTPTAEPAELTIASSATGQNPAATEEFRGDRIMVADGYIGYGPTLAGGSTVELDLDSGLNTDDLFLLASLSGSGTWYQLDTGITSGTVTISQWPPAGGALVSGIPPADPTIGYARIQPRISAGATDTLAVRKPLRSSRVANGIDETLYTGTFALPPGGKPEYGPLPPWRLDFYGEGNVGGSAYGLTIKALWLFETDETGAVGITVAAPGLAVQAEWHIGTDRWGRPYAYLLSKSDGSYLGALAPTGALFLRGGNNLITVMVETDDGSGNMHLADLTHLKFKLGLQATPRYHLSAHASPVVGV